MASPDESSSIIEKALEKAERIFNVMWYTDTHQDLWHWLVLIFMITLITFVTVIVLLKSLGSLTEQIVKLIEVYKTSGLPIWHNKENKTRIRRRKQFCSVLEADLSYLAKAENWNDQYFTDLEAEVETEGGYYATAIDKLRRKKSFGLRKERSLIRAITSSTERAMQLVGEPGSGKSVALRHLAKQFSERGRRSNDKNAIVPLYINLREMEFSSLEDINADNVREFVLDNIRRGDADTSAFVKENWDDYCNRGIWLFLFDSFDEIPAVLHSTAGNNIIRNYSQALRHFLEGMGECKGILASREFKGPEALPWKKLRILPLSGEKQDELIRNSFLNDQHMNMVRQHLANSHSSIGSTPLFLTLLCRYVRDEKKAPNNDHDILLQHIERLAKREPEYLLKKYNMRPSELIIGAERLARLFAENDTMSLAPSLDQITAQLPANQVPGGSIERLISALVDSKIGRADVPNAAQGDRRFAFAHRRYQEVLFVGYLTTHPETLSAKELLTEQRWREYTVTLLQTRGIEETNDLLLSASSILMERANQQNYNACGQAPLPKELVYFDWSSEIAIPLLSLLQEGLVHRLHDVPPQLSSAVAEFLKPRWEKGDSWDRCEVLRLGGLLPNDMLVEYLVETFNYGTNSERQNAFKQAAFTSDLPKEVRNVVLEMLSNQVILATNRADQLTIEALAGRLPSNMGANIVVARSKRLRRNFELVKKIIPKLFLIEHWSMFNKFFDTLSNSFGESRISFKYIKENHPDLTIKLSLNLTFVMLFTTMILLTILSFKFHSNFIYSALILTFIITLSFSILFSPYIVRHHGHKIRTIDILSSSIKYIKSPTFIKATLKYSLLMFLFFLLCAILGYALSWVIRSYIPINIIDLGDKSISINITLGFAIIITLTYALLIPKIIITAKQTKSKYKNHIDKLNVTKKTESTDIEILYSAESYEQLVYWLHHDNTLLSDINSIRTFSSFILHYLRIEEELHNHTFTNIPLCLQINNTRSPLNGEEYSSTFDVLRQTIEERFLKHYN